MSLFPAYNTEETTGKIIEPQAESKEQNWLTNSSFNRDAGVDVGHSEPDTSKVKESRKESRDLDTQSHRKKKKSKFHRKHKKKDSSDHDKKYDNSKDEIQKKDDFFYVDKKCEKGNLSVPTLYRPAVPKYYINNVKTLGGNHLFLKISKKKRKKEFFKSRYFAVNHNKKCDPLYTTDPTKPNEDNDEIFAHTHSEQNFSKTTGDFNRKLAEEPNNIDLWMKYVQFQDSIYLFEKSNHTHTERVTAEKKLSILDKAILLNPLSDALLKERFRIAENIFNPDQIAEETSRYLEKDPSNLILWRSLINSTRNNMTRCTVPNVLRMFTRAITRLHQLRRGASKDFILNVEKNILVLVLECGLFLQQAGLWEQMWTLLQMYLTLNLAHSEPSHFKTDVSVSEKQLLDEEDAIINSGLPLPTLWVRVEHLRSSVHFLPVETSDDPQRSVFPEDVADLLQPLTTSQLNLQLVITVITLLKVPLLPTRQSTLEMLSFLDIGSCMNNVESLLAAVYPVGPVLDFNYDYLSEITNLSIEPQFIRGKFGCTEFLTYITSVMKTCGSLLANQESVIVHCWVLRFYRLLLRLESTKLTTLPSFIAKQSKAYSKELLKQQQYRDCLQLYTEYALVERDLGNLSGACRILETAAKLRHNIPEAERPVHTALYHALIDTMLQDTQLDRNKAISALVSLVEMQPLTLEVRSPVEVKKALVKSRHIATEIITEAASKSTNEALLCDCFLPHLCVEWIACHAWFLYLTQSVWAGSAYVEETMICFQHVPNTTGYIWREQLWEILVSMLHYHVVHQASGYSVLRDTLCRAVREYPNNLYLLNTVAVLETSSVCGTLWWKLMTYFPADSTLARLVLIFIARSKLKQRSSGDLETDHSSGNRLYNLLKNSTLNPVTKKCPLIWRLYLQFVAHKEDKLAVKNTFYKALEECPWVKCLYFEAAQFIPEELAEIQDLIIEKELRLHTTPEELEELRVDERPKSS